MKREEKEIEREIQFLLQKMNREKKERVLAYCKRIY